MADDRPGADQPDHPLDRPSVAVHGDLVATRASRLSDPAQPELLVEFRFARRDHAGGDDRHRHLPCDAIYAERAARLRLGRAHHARRQLRLADALRPRQRRVDVLCDRLHPYFPRALLRLLQGTARIAVDPWRDHPDIDDSDCVHGIRAAVGADELLGRHRDHQFVFGDPARRPQHRHVPVGRLYRRRSDPAPLLCAALPAALRNPGCRAAASDRAAPLRLQQSVGH